MMRTTRWHRFVLSLTALLWLPLAGAATPGKVELLWLGQSAMRITTPTGKVIMLDPWLTTNPKTPAGYKNLDAIGKLDLILVTHGHGDHLGDAPALAKKNNVPMWGPAGMNQALQTLGVLSAELAPRMSKSGTITPFPGDATWKYLKVRPEVRLDYSPQERFGSDLADPDSRTQFTFAVDAIFNF